MKVREGRIEDVDDFVMEALATSWSLAGIHLSGEQQS